MRTPVVLRRGMPVLVLLLATCALTVFTACDDGDDPIPSTTPTVDIGAPGLPGDTSTPAASASPDAATDSGEARRTGDPALDAIIEAVEERDIATLSGLVEYQEIGCTNALGMGGPPKCTDGQEHGDISRVFPHSACEGTWTRDPIPVLAQFVSRADGAWAALGVTEYPAGTEWPAPDTFLAFHSIGLDDPDSIEDIAIYLEVTDGRITRSSVVCIGPLEGLLESDAWHVEVIAGPWEEARPAPKVETPTTGIPDVDAVIESVATYDWPALRENALETMQSGPLMPCGGPGGPGHVACDPKDGEPGDEVHAFPMAFCSGELARDPGDPLSAFLNAVPRLHSVVEAPTEPSGSELYPQGTYWLVYEFTSVEPAEEGASYGVVSREGARLQLTEDGGIAVLWYGCSPTVEELASYAGEPLPVIWDGNTAPSSLGEDVAECVSRPQSETPWPEVAGGGPTDGPVTMALPSGPVRLRSNGIWKVLMLLDPSEASIGTPIEFRESPESEATGMLFQYGEADFGSPYEFELPWRELTDDGPYDAPGSMWFPAPGCYTFEVLVDGSARGPFSILVESIAAE